MRYTATAINWNIIRCLSLVGLLSFAGLANGQPFPLTHDPMGAPFRIRDYTFPNFLVLGFAPAPSSPLGRGHYSLEFHYSVINNFQTSHKIENYLKQNHVNHRQPLSAADVQYILSLPEGQAFYIDGEFSMFELVFHKGLTDRIDVGVGANYIHYGGHLLDEAIFNFHDLIRVGQGGREHVQNEQVQVVLGEIRAKISCC